MSRIEPVRRRWLAWLWLLPVPLCLLIDLVNLGNLAALGLSMIASLSLGWVLQRTVRGLALTHGLLIAGAALIAALIAGYLGQSFVMTASWLGVVLVGFLVRGASLWPAGAGAALLLLAPLRLGSSAPMVLMAMVTALAIAAAVGSALRGQAETAARARVEAINAERQRMAAELHDVIAHEVTGIIVLAQAAQAASSAATSPASATTLSAYAASPPPSAAEVASLARIEQAGARAMSQIRAMVTTLREETTDHTDGAGIPTPVFAPLTPTPQGPAGVADAVAAHPGPVTLNAVDLPAAALDTAGWLALARATTEGLTNVRRHAGADTQAEVRLAREAGSVILTVRDEGSGMDFRQGARPGLGGGSGSGLVGLSARVRSVGGTVDAGPEPTGGWLLTVRIPESTTTAEGASS